MNHTSSDFFDHAAINTLAAAAGVSREWTDANGQAQVVSTDSLRAVLAALGLPCETGNQCRDSQAQLALQQSGTGLPALVTATIGAAVQLPLPAAIAGTPYRITLENGGTVAGQLALDTSGHICLPAVAQSGYHQLLVADTGCTLAVAPERCYGVADALGLYADNTGPGSAATRCWGLGAQLYSLRRPGDGGIGDFGALDLLSRHAATQGAAAVAISPVHAMFSADTSRFSPYGPSSRLFLNAMHIDPDAVAGPTALTAALSSLDASARATLAALEREPLIDWPVAGRLRLQLLRALFDQTTAGTGSGSLGAGFTRFCQQGGEALADHARFEVLHALQLAQGGAGDWRRWPLALRDPRNPEVAALAATHAREVDFHLFLQWQAANGLAAAQATARSAGMPIGLVADLAIGADRGGSQAWSRQAQMLHGLAVGAPPDILNTRGQDWGLGAFSPHAMQMQGFAAYIEMLRAVFAHCGGVRIDHVLGLARLWLVPDGAASSSGAYLQYPMQDMLRLIALESHRSRAIVIGEDLGTVPAGFDTQLAAAGLLGIRVLYFETAESAYKPPATWSDQAIATTTTHDLPTVGGWWRGCDIEWRTRLDLLAPGETEPEAQAQRATEREALWSAFTREGMTDLPLPSLDQEATAIIVDAALGYVAATPAPLAIIPLEDLLGLEQQPNLPGTVDTHPNWRRRLPTEVEHLFDTAEVRQRLALLNLHRSLSKTISKTT